MNSKLNRENLPICYLLEATDRTDNSNVNPLTSFTRWKVGQQPTAGNVSGVVTFWTWQKWNIVRRAFRFIHELLKSTEDIQLMDLYWNLSVFLVRTWLKFIDSYLLSHRGLVQRMCWLGKPTRATNGSGTCWWFRQCTTLREAVQMASVQSCTWCEGFERNKTQFMR